MHSIDVNGFYVCIFVHIFFGCPRFLFVLVELLFLFFATCQHYNQQFKRSYINNRHVCIITKDKRIFPSDLSQASV